MSVVSAEPSESERNIAMSLRREIEKEVARRELDYDDVAELLGVMPVAVEALFSRQVWPLGVCVRVASALGLDVRIDVQARR
jgi:predicted transcriptional regulator